MSLVLIGIGGFQSHEAVLQPLQAKVGNPLGDGAKTGAGRYRDLGGAMSNHALQVKHANATTLVVSLDGSLNGVDYFSLGTWTLGTQANGDIIFVTGKPVCFVRANITTLTTIGAGVGASTWITSTG